MSNSLNKCQFIGNIGSEITVKTTPNGQIVANFNLACGRSWKDAQGNKQEQTEWIPVVIWGKMAEIVEKYSGKGKKVYVEGRLQTRTWENQDGVKVYKTEIIGENVILLSSGGERKEENQQQFQDSGIDFGDEDPEFDAMAARAKDKVQKRKDEQDISIEDIPW